MRSFRFVLIVLSYSLPSSLLAEEPPPQQAAPPSAEKTASPAGDRAILEVIINGHNEGQQFLKITPDGDVQLPPKLLESLRLRPELWAGQSGEQISLRSLTPKLQLSLDQNSAVLNLAVPPEWFKPQVIRSREESAPSQEEKEPLRPLPWAGFFSSIIAFRRIFLNRTTG